ncbi:MAG: hypothetical protein HZA46_08335 [Planctomycetales bacterium]|nr:hypothetical protein [Planctomycetales bacterium]
MHLVRAGKTLLCVVALVASSFQTVHADKKFSFKRSKQQQQADQQAQPAQQEPFAAQPVYQPPQPYDPAENLLTRDQLVDRAIAETARRRLTAGMHTPWQIVHGILALRWDFLLMKSPGSPETIRAIEWMASGPSHDGLPLWQATPYGGRGQPFTKPYAFEGHPTQFMGYMTMADIPEDYKFKADLNGEKTITIRDIINDAKMQVKEGPEITWTLWALAHYEAPDAEWTNAVGEPWSIERLVKIQTAEQVITGACGGCHGLFALAYARNKYLATGQPLRGVWLEADQKIKRYIEEARSLQNSDGTFSSNHFKGPGWAADFPTRIATSGHQLEWLMIALPKSRLNEEWVTRAVERVSRDIWDHRRDPSDCGPLYHAVHSLVMYRLRTRPSVTPSTAPEPQVANKNIPESKPSTTVQEPKETSTKPTSIVAKVTESVVTPSVVTPKVTADSAGVSPSDSKATATPETTRIAEAKSAEKTGAESSKAVGATGPQNDTPAASNSSTTTSTARPPTETNLISIPRRSVADAVVAQPVAESIRSITQGLIDPDLELGLRDGADLNLPSNVQKSATAGSSPKRSARQASSAPTL